MSWLKTVFNKLENIKHLKQQRGAIFVLTALLLPVLLGFMGFAYDIGNLYMHKSRLQNVADAAALAGGRAFLESQDKTTGTKDTIDASAGDGRAEETYTIDGSKTRSGKHPDADTAADSYIYKNIVNLGTEVHSDKYSHYALYSTSNPTNTSPKIFYRVGLYEDVPLYFLPVIIDKKEQRVRAGAVVLVEKGMGAGGGGSDTEGVTSPSIFDNLFAFSEWLFTRNLTTAQGEILSSFTGNMVYTHLNNTEDAASSLYIRDGLQPSSYFHYEASVGGINDEFPYTHMYQDGINTNVKTSGGIINDPTVDTFYDTKAYLEAFKGKLNEPHFDVTSKDDTYYFHIPEYDPSPNSTCRGKYTINGKQGVYFKDGDNYYLLNNDGEYFSAQKDGKTYNVVYHKFPGTENYGIEIYFLCHKYENETTYYILNANGDESNCRIINTGNGEEGRIDDVIMRWNNGLCRDWWPPITEGDLKDGVALEAYVSKDDFTLQVSSSGDGTTNVYHILLNRLNQDGTESSHPHQTVYISIDEQIKGDNVNKPVYVLVEGIYQVQIVGTAATTGRPVIIVFLSEGTGQIKYEFNGGEFIGTIYAPVSTFEHVKGMGTSFKGNIIAKTINVQSTQEITWVQENHLEKYKYVYYEDTKGDYVLDNGTYRKAEKNEIDNPAITKYVREIVYNYMEDANGDYVREANGRYRKWKEGDTGTRYSRGAAEYDYLDTAIKAVSDKIAEKIEAANQNANLTDDLKNDIYKKLGLKDDEITAMNKNPNWYNEQTFGRKKELYQSWRTLYDEYKNDKNKAHLVNLLWPWNEHFDIGKTEPTGDTLRIINFRTEFRDSPKDPFVDLSLDMSND